MRIRRVEYISRVFADNILSFGCAADYGYILPS